MLHRQVKQLKLIVIILQHLMRTMLYHIEYSQHTQNIQINKVIGDNEKSVFYFIEKTTQTFQRTQCKSLMIEGTQYTQEIAGILRITMSSEKKGHFIFFLIYITSFIYFCLIALAKTSSIRQRTSGMNRYLCLFIKLREENIQSFYIKYGINCKLFRCFLQNCRISAVFLILYKFFSIMDQVH